MTRAELLKVAKPILFNTEMVKAIQDGRKTVTRRVIKDQPYNCFKESAGEFVLCDKRAFYTDENSYKNIQTIKSKYQVGDILYVRETWQEKKMLASSYFYKADEETNSLFEKVLGKWRPSIHMPKEAARIFLRVTGVRVERLQDIDDDGAKSEGANIGVGWEEKMLCSAIDRFIEIWNSTVKPVDFDQFSFGANPWVWVYDFERLEHEQ